MTKPNIKHLFNIEMHILQMFACRLFGFLLVVLVPVWLIVWVFVLNLLTLI